MVPLSASLRAGHVTCRSCDNHHHCQTWVQVQSEAMFYKRTVEIPKAPSSKTHNPNVQ